jgi:NADP-dependent 3-hydroxy acid dehydrogenase YdfG
MEHHERTAAQIHTKVTDLAGKAAAISGGTSGIGLATAQLLASYGARVFVFGKDEDKLDAAIESIEEAGAEAFGIAADQSRPEDVRRIFHAIDEQLGGLDIFVNNAAEYAGELLDEDETAWRRCVETNLLGYMACAREALLRMVPKGQGHLVNVGSMSADLREKGKSVYVTTKAGIQAFSEALRKEVNHRGIKVSLIEPGLVGTPLTEKPEDEMQRREQKGEMLKPEDIAVAIHYCLTQPARCDVVSIQIRPHLQEI